MLRFPILFAVLLAAFPAGPARAEPADIAAAARSVVRVVLLSVDGENVSLVGHGSGVAIAPDLILTNAHVLAPAEQSDAIRIGVVPSQGRDGWFTRIVALSPANDLALLRLTERGALPAATLFTGALDDGADVFAVGYPGNVDLAQGLSMGDLVTPTSPVKTRGNVSSGRSAKAFDTILHTAAIGMGNSGGPLLDTCGRIAGINSFGTVSGESDSEFYFAVSVREIMRFLRAAKVSPRTSGLPCRSIADLDRAEAERLAGERAGSEVEERAATLRRDAARREAERQAQREVIGARENGMALAGLALLLALAAGGAAFACSQKDKRRETRIAAIAAFVLLAGGLAAWLSRPSLDAIDERAEALAKERDQPASAAAPAPAAGAGALVCVLDPARSRVTVSAITDVPLDWRADGCVNQRSQYGLAADGWSRVLVPNEEQTVTVASYEPATARYKTERYLLDLETMAKLRAERSKFAAPSCGGGEDAARALGESQAALKALLPAPNERLVYACRAATPGG